MIKPVLGAYFLCLAGVLLALSGCQTTSPDISAAPKDVMQFEPTPRPELGAEELAPVDGRSVTELLREADKSFQAANTAQQQGDQAAAVKHYTDMLQFLSAANLDPSIFYSVREEFGQILEESSKQYAYNPKQPRFFRPGEVQSVESMGALQIPFPLPEQVLQEIDEIQRVYPKGFQRGLNRSFKYIPWIKEEMRKAGLPEELAWLAMVESQYNEKIDSPAGAGGMWQFMKATAQHYNLRYDNYVDERYNWQSATRAAIAYLTELYDMFGGSWPLAITSYNMGPGGLQRAIDSNKGQQDFWTLLVTPPASDRMKQETKKYFPRFLATCIVASNPERYGFTLSPETPVETVRMPVPGIYALGDLDKALNLEPGTLAKLNPDLIAEITPPSGDYSIAILPGHQEVLAAALPNIPQASPGSSRRSLLRTVLGGSGGSAKGGTHKVQRGETIASIARKHRVSSEELVQANNLKGARMLRVGQTLRIPGQGSAPASQDEQMQLASVEKPSSDTAAKKASRSEKVTKTYTVRRGDTLSSIASKFKVSVKDLQAWNKLDKRSRIHAGSTLKVLSPESAATEEAPLELAEAPKVQTKGGTSRERVHEVRRGDYLSKIAKEYGVELDQLLAWNDLKKDSTLRVGDKLVIRGGDAGVQAALAETDEAATRFHEVKRGEYPAKIAAEYGVKLKDLLAWNDLDPKATLHVGDKLKIRGGEGGAPAETGLNEELKLAAEVPDSLDRPERVHEVRPGDSPSKIASDYGVPLDSLLAWNNLKKGATIRVGDKLVLRGGKSGGAAPATKSQEKAATVEAPEAPQGGQEYIVRAGDFPAKIAKAHGVSVKDLLAWNNLGAGATLKVGDKLKIHGGMASAPEAEPVVTQAAATGSESSAGDTGATSTHKVAKGESPSSIASKYKVKLADLLAWNNLNGKSVLKIDQELVIRGGAVSTSVAKAETAAAPAVESAPAAAKAKVPAAGQQTKHAVAKGESPSSIASKYKVKLADLLAWNGLNSKSVLKIGQELVVQGASGGSGVKVAKASPEGNRITHVVSAGHNPTTIAKRYGVNIADLYKWNGWPEKHVLHVGDEVTVYKP